MKAFILAAALVALAAPASAQSEPGLGEVRISGALLRIELPEELRNVWQDEFDQVKGTYRLSNGKTMQLSMWGNRMYAKVDGMDRMQLVALGPHVFVGLDKQIKIRITDMESSGPIAAEVLLMVPTLAGTATEGTVTRLVASR